MSGCSRCCPPRYRWYAAPSSATTSAGPRKDEGVVRSGGGQVRLYDDLGGAAEGAVASRVEPAQVEGLPRGGKIRGW